MSPDLPTRDDVGGITHNRSLEFKTLLKFIKEILADHLDSQRLQSQSHAVN